MDNYNENKYKLRIDALTQQLTKVGNEYYATVEVLKAKDIELNETRHELNETRHELNETRHELNETRHELNETRHELNETRHELNETRHELNETRHELNETRHELNETRHEFLSLMNSKSWKITKPLRFTVQSLKLLLKR